MSAGGFLPFQKKVKSLGVRKSVLRLVPIRRFKMQQISEMRLKNSIWDRDTSEVPRQLIS